jgi:hypothetical protein
MSYCSIEEAWGIKMSAPPTESSLNNGIMLDGRYQGRDMMKRNVSNRLSREPRMTDRSITDASGSHVQSHQEFRNNNYEDMLQQQMNANQQLPTYNQTDVHNRFLSLLGKKDTKECMTDTASSDIAAYNSMADLQAIDLQTPLNEPMELGQYYIHESQPQSYSPEIMNVNVGKDNDKDSRSGYSTSGSSSINDENMKIIKSLLARIDVMENDIIYLKSNQSPKVLGTNIHDIILFILAGIFIIFVLDGIFKIGRSTI